jgi:hypothetical protein
LLSSQNVLLIVKPDTVIDWSRAIPEAGALNHRNKARRLTALSKAHFSLLSNSIL